MPRPILPKTILLVEDEALIAMNESAMLKKHGYSVITAYNAEKAMETVREKAVDLILMDIDLGQGKIDGTEAAEIILKEKDIPVVFLSSHTEPEVVKKTEGITSYGYIVKNSGETVLLTSIKMAFRLFEAKSIYKDTFDHSINGICIHKMIYNEKNGLRDCEYINVNSAFEKHTGLSSDFVNGKTIREIYPGNEADNVIDVYSEVIASGTPQIKEIYFKPTEQWYELSVFPMEDNHFSVVLQSITDRRDFEEKLRASEEKHRRLFETMAQGVVYQGADGTIISANPASEKLLGLSFEQMNGRTSMDPRWKMITEDGEEVPGSEHPAMAALRTGEKVGPVTRGVFVPEREEYVWLLITAIPLFQPGEGKPYQVYATFDDITERKRAEDALRENEKFAKAVMDNLPIGIAVNSVDPAVEFSYMNDNFPKIYRTTREALANPDTFWDVVYEDPVFRQQIKKKVMDDCASGNAEKMYWEDISFTRNGEGPFYICARNIPLEDTKMMISTVWDVTDRKKAEKKLQAEEDNLQLTLNSIGDAVISTDNKGRIVRMNPVAERLCGWKEAEAYGEKLEEVFYIINADTRKRVDNPVDSVMRTGIIAGLANHTLLLSKDGKEYQISDSAAPIKDDNGIINGVVLVFRDVTEQYEKDRQIQERMKELDCLYKIADIVEKPGIALKEILQQTAEVLPESWFYPDICEAGITLHRQTFQTTNFTLTEWSMSSNVIVDGFVSGEVTVCYREEKPSRDEGPFLKGERRLLNAVAERLGRIIERKQAEENLRSIEWMLSNKSTRGEDYIPEYGDVSFLNKDGLILTSVGKVQLKDIASEYLDLLETSTAIYEKNGDYALGIFSSGWGQLMDSASRRLCDTEDNREALDSGQWLCHESCWKDASLAITENRPVEIECNGGIKMYAVPVHANGKTVGAINFGYGSPPTDEAELKRLSEKYNIPIDELRRNAKAYNPRPQFIIDYAKERIQIAAKNLGYFIERKRTEEALKREDIFLSSVLDNMKEAIIICNEKGEIIRFNESARRLHNLPEKRISAEQWAEYYDLYYPDGYTLLATEDIPLFRALKGEDVVNIEIMVAPKDSNRHYLLSCNGRQLIDAEGEITGAVIAMFDITDRKQKEKKLQKALEEKDYLMKELNHRVKNNLNMVSSLISLKNSSLSGEADLSDLDNRINAIRLIHEKLYQAEDFSHINLKEYIHELNENVFSLSKRHVEIEEHIDGIFLSTKTAIPLGLIINELATNAMKHGFTDGREAVFSVDLTEDKNKIQYILKISNTGKPFPKDVTLDNPATLGLQLISALVSQLEGTIELQRDPHPVFTIRFPIEQ